MMSNHVFSLVPRAEIPRSRFKRDHTYKTTLNAGLLVPFFWDEVLPGDTFNVRTTMFCRMATLISPIMDDLYIDTHYFFVPARLVWSNWERFMGAQEDPTDSIDYVVPKLFGSTVSTVAAESLDDYMGLPLGSIYGGDKLNVSALPFRAYALIWNEWFRDENLQNSATVIKSDNVGMVVSTDFPNGAHNYAGSCFPRNKRHDYFSSALPWPQKPLNGSVSIAATIPLNGSANVFGNGKALGLTDGTDNAGPYILSDGYAIHTAKGHYGDDVGTSQTGTPVSLAASKALGVVTKTQAGTTPANSGLVADLSTATGATINQLREAFQIQRFLEKSARTGTRYTEIIRGMFGVVSPDARLQRPEYLGGSSNRIQVNVVPQTSGSVSGVTPQANLSAFATGTNGRGDGFTKSFTEHGFVFGLVSIRGPLIYQQGINRSLSRNTRFDYYWPTFAHLGEQAVLNKEIYAQGTAEDNDVFGYQERYAEYRYFPSMVTGKFRSTYAQSLDAWHLAQKFDSLPTLSDQFIREKPPIGRVIAVPSEPEFLLDVDIKMDCARPLPLYGVPGLIDHF